MALDMYGQETTGSDVALAGWNKHLSDLLMMSGDPLVGLDSVAQDDESFLMGSVFTGAYRVLGGLIPTGEAIQQDLERAKSRRSGANDRERRHVGALEKFVSGDFPGAANDWADIVRDYPQDLAATRIAHDVCLHYGDTKLRMRVANDSMTGWSSGDNGYGVAIGMYSFALEEEGKFDEAEEAALKSLEANNDDAWALHSLAHTYEHLDAHEKSVSMMENNMSWWTNSNLLSNHVWWHLAIRLIDSGEFDRCLEIADSQMAEVETGFGLSDLSSLLWRLELAGCDVGDRWESAAERWARVSCTHTCGFLDVHAAMALSSDSESEGSRAFREGLDHPHYGGSANGEVLAKVSAPLARAIYEFRDGNYDLSARLLDEVGDATQLIGGSNAQREILVKTRAAALEKADPEAAGRFYAHLLGTTPDRVWVNRAVSGLATS